MPKLITNADPPERERITLASAAAMLPMPEGGQTEPVR